MQSVVIVLASLAAWGGLWWYAARYFKGKGHGGIVSHLSGIAVGFLGSTVLLLLLIGTVQPSGSEQPSPQESKAEDKVIDAPAATTVTAPATNADLASPSDIAPKKQAHTPHPGKTLKLSAEQILTSLPRLDQTASPLMDGTPRTNVKLSTFAHLELIGDQRDVSRYTVMFGLPNDDKSAVIETSVMAAKVLMNTFPAWEKQGNNPMTWLGDATEQLTKNIKRNKDEPKAVVMERDGRRITYKAVPVLGIFLLTVEPV
ncbi:hypothetical protein CNECB9_5260039 [Cupriavidus necator]|uniref:Uncharacterized protein n=1 Tax=Cupriavidus necator TaxID=106590 RepID=A0A1K0IPW2_CUPNE|nr:hypothetical protein CNECB9_5260039 [Cupriavidus necator]